MAVFAAWQNFNRPYAIRDGHPEPYFGLLCENTDFGVFQRSIPRSAAVVYLYYLYDHPPGPVRTAHQWLAIKISTSARTVEVLDPTSKLCGRVTPIQRISAALRQGDTLAPFATRQITWVKQHYHDDIWESGYGCLSWAHYGGLRWQLAVRRGAGEESVTWMIQTTEAGQLVVRTARDRRDVNLDTERQDAWRQYWQMIGQTVLVDDESYRLFTTGPVCVCRIE